MHKKMGFSLPAAWARKTCIKLLVKYVLPGGASKGVGGSEVGGLMQPQGPSLFLFCEELRQCISHQPRRLPNAQTAIGASVVMSLSRPTVSERA